MQGKLEIAITIMVPVVYDYDPGQIESKRGHPDTWYPSYPDSLELFIDTDCTKIMAAVQEELNKGGYEDAVFDHMKKVEEDNIMDHIEYMSDIDHDF
jgi:hypothetical protein